MVARGLVLLVGRLVLLVHDDDAQVGQRREDGRPRADDDVGQAGRDLLPEAMPLGGGQAAVQDGDVTRDVGGTLGTREAGEAVLERLS